MIIKCFFSRLQMADKNHRSYVFYVKREILNLFIVGILKSL